MELLRKLIVQAQNAILLNVLIFILIAGIEIFTFGAFTTAAKMFVGGAVFLVIVLIISEAMEREIDQHEQTLADSEEEK